jgi:hypothetical protein
MTEHFQSPEYFFLETADGFNGFAIAPSLERVTCRSELDIPSNLTETSQISFKIPTAITDQNPLSVIAKVVMNIFGHYYNVAISTGGATLQLPLLLRQLFIITGVF